MASDSKEEPSKIKVTCNNLKKYYENLNRKYDNLFTVFCDDNGVEDDDALLTELNEPPDQSILTDFDDNFPFIQPPPNKQRNILKLHLITKCYQNEPITTTQLPKFNDKFFNIAETDKDKMKEILARQCPKLFDKGMANDDNLFNMLAIGHKTGFDYFHHLVDTWFRYRITHEIVKKKPAIKISNWIEKNNKHFQMLKKIKLRYGETAYDLAKTAIVSFPARICPQLMLQPLIEINDSLEKTITYLESACTFIQTLITESSPDKTMRAICPFQFDLCICSSEPKRNKNNVTENDDGKNDDYDDYDDDDDDDDDNDEKDTYVDSVGDIKAKLFKNKLKNQTETIRTDDNNEGINQRRVFIRLFNKMDFKDSFDAQNDDKFYFVHRRRLIGMVDRRDDTQNADPIYLYQPPNNCCQIENNALTSSYISLSRTCLLPNMEYGDGSEALKKDNVSGAVYDQNKNANIGSDFHCGGSLLTFSFIVKNVDEIKIYLYWNGQIIRFMPEDVLTLLPVLFNMKYEGNTQYLETQKNEINDRINLMNEIIRDNNFEAFQQIF